MRESASRVVRRIDEYALDLPPEFLLQRLESEQVVAEDEPVVESRAGRGGAVIAECRVFEQDARFQLRPDVLPDSRQFKLCLRHVLCV